MGYHHLKAVFYPKWNSAHDNLVLMKTSDASSGDEADIMTTHFQCATTKWKHIEKLVM